MEYKKYFSSSPNNYFITLIVTEKNVSDVNNTSDVDWVLTATKTSGTGRWDNSGRPVNVIINNTQVFNANVPYDFRNSTPQTITLAKGTVTGIKHNDDGSKSLPVYAYVDWSDNTLGTATINENMTLTTIARASEVGVTDTYIGSTASIIIAKKNTTFTHTLRYSYSDNSGTIVTKTANQTYPWTVPTNIYQLIPNAKSLVVTIYCDTYNGNTLIGTKQTTFRAIVNEEINAPDLSAVLEDVNSKTQAILHDKQHLIKFFSDVKTTITATPKNGATITSYLVSCWDGKSAKTQVSTLIGVEDGAFTIEVVDSRGIASRITKTLSIDPYVKLTLNPTIKRTTTTGSEVKLSLSGNYYVGPSSEKASWDTLSVKLRYKKRTDTSWSEYVDITDFINYSISNENWNTYYLNDYVINASFDYREIYDFEIIAEDRLMNVTSSMSIARGQPNHWWNKNSFTHNTDVFLKSGNKLLDYEPIDDWAVRLKDGKFLDSTSVAHNQKLLSDKLKEMIVSGENGFSKNIDNQDVNEIRNCGFYYGNKIINAPSEYGYLLVISHSFNKNYCIQLFKQSSPNTSDQKGQIVYTRSLYDNAWSTWVPMNSIGEIRSVPSSVNWDDLYSYVGVGVKVFSVGYASTVPKGFPTGAYTYGTLVMICCRATGEFNDAQIYITDSVASAPTSSDRGIYVRARKGTSWLRISGTKVLPTT